MHPNFFLYNEDCKKAQEAPPTTVDDLFIGMLSGAPHSPYSQQCVRLYYCDCEEASSAASISQYLYLHHIAHEHVRRILSTALAVDWRLLTICQVFPRVQSYAKHQLHVQTRDEDEMKNIWGVACGCPALADVTPRVSEPSNHGL